MLDVMNNGIKPALTLQVASRLPVPRLRVRFSAASPFGAPHPEHVAAMQHVVRLLENMGHAIEEAPAPSGTLEDFLPLWQKLVASAPIRKSKAQPVTAWLIDVARGLSRAAVATLHDNAVGKVEAMFGNADIFVSPTTIIQAPRIGEWQSLPPSAAFTAAAGLAGLTAPFNITGQPACSIPTGLSSNGLPIGVQLVAKRNQDGLLLALARMLEPQLGFYLRPPR